MNIQRAAVILTLGGLAVTLATNPLLAAEGEEAKPKAVVAEPMTDAGVMAPGEKYAHDFVIRNEGNAELVISEVRPACGCTVAEFDQTIPPGGTGKVHTVLDTSGFAGPIAKGIAVYTNDPVNPKIDLVIRADVQHYIAMVPGYARYIAVKKEVEKGTIHQTLWAADGQDFKILKVDSPLPYLSAHFREAKEDEKHEKGKGRQWIVETTLWLDEAPIGPIADYVVVHTDHPKQKEVRLPISGFIRPIFAVTPPTADFGERELSEPFKASLHVKNFATEEIPLTKVETNVQGLQAELTPLKEGREYAVLLTLKPEMPKGDFRGKLRIYTASSKQEVIEVEVKGRVL